MPFALFRTPRSDKPSKTKSTNSTKTMKSKLNIKIAAILGFVWIAMFSGCTTEQAKALDGKLLKDAEGNYYKVVTKNLGCMVALSEVDFDELPQKF